MVNSEDSFDERVRGIALNAMEVAVSCAPRRPLTLWAMVERPSYTVTLRTPFDPRTPRHPYFTARWANGQITDFAIKTDQLDFPGSMVKHEEGGLFAIAWYAIDMI